MLVDAKVCAAVPVTDIERARRFYGQTLGLAEAEMGDEDEAFYLAGQTMLHVYEGLSRSPATGHTVATFLVENLDEEMGVLRGRDVDIVDYDTPDMKTANGVFRRYDGFTVAWIKDPDGNILSIEQLA